MANGRTSNQRVDAERKRLRQVRAARVRAARAYADLGQVELATALGVSVVTVKRMERGSRDISLEELHTLADLCGFPRAWMEEGFQDDGGNGHNGHDEAETSRAMFALAHEFSHLRAAFADVLQSQVDAREVSREAIERLRRPADGLSEAPSELAESSDS